MVATNGFFWFALLTILGVHLLDLICHLLNLRSLGSLPPPGLEDIYPPEDYARSQRYTRQTTHLDLWSGTISLAIFLLFWLLGGFGWLDRWVRSQYNQPLLQGLLFASVLYLAQMVLSLPVRIYSTFVIEEQFGFNRTSWGTFLSDLIKELFLAGLLGLPLLAFVLWVFQVCGSWAWLIGWTAFALISLGLAYLAPQWILPLFHRFELLPEGELKSAIQDMARRCEFPLREVYQIDGSRRSSKTNAFFTGFGKNKRIALFDTLIQNHSVDELVAVLAHEVGHYRRHHQWKHMAVAVLETGVLFYLLGIFLNNQGLFDAFAVPQVSIYGSLVLFAFLFTPVSRILGIGSMIMSRRHEFEADAYAAQQTNGPQALVTGLKKLARENLSNLAPHPVFVFLNYSHPPMKERIAALERRFSPMTEKGR
jgi:STE24 endopeptidase